MKNCVILGQLPEDLTSAFSVDGFGVIYENSEIDLLKNLKKNKPFFCLLEIGKVRFQSVQYIREAGVPVIIFTPHELDLTSLEYVKAGAIDVISLKEPSFSSKTLESVQHFLTLHNNGFIHKVLKDSEELYHAIIEGAPVLILVCNLDGHIVVSNHVANTFLYLTEEEDSIIRHLDPILQDEFLNIMREVSESGQTIKTKCSVETNGQSARPISWRLSNFDHILQGTVLLYGEDVSDYEEIRKNDFFKTKSLLSMNDRLDRANKSLDQFSSMISHDLKNGLNRIQGFLRVLARKEETNFSSEGRELLDKANQSTLDMVETINRILDFAKSKGSNIEIRPFSLNNLVNRLIADFQPQINGVNGNVFLVAENEIMIEADLICIKQVFENLLGNAIKYRSPERKLVLKIILDDMGADVCISFEDNGLGVKPEDKDKIFETYFRNVAVEGKIEGYGIGLSTVKTLLEAHGGMIWVDTDNVVGSTFNVQLPKKQ